MPRPFLPRTFTDGVYSVTVNADRSILVKPGDWISKYSAAIYGDAKANWTKFKRKDSSGRYIELTDPHKIEAGKLLYHPDPLPGEPPESGEPSCPGIYFAIYYDVADQAFYRAAVTWELELPCSAIKVRVQTESDFVKAWDSVNARSLATGLPVMKGQIFSHSSKGSSDDGLEFGRGGGRDGTLSQGDIEALPKLNWAPDGKLILAGCNSGLAAQRGWTPAETFANSQGVKTIGQGGFTYFSRIKSSYSQIDDKSQSVYLWAYRRGRNAPVGNGARMPGIEFSP